VEGKRKKTSSVLPTDGAARPVEKISGNLRRKISDEGRVFKLERGCASNGKKARRERGGEVVDMVPRRKKPFKGKKGSSD